jgi:hypothetical protein
MERNILSDRVETVSSGFRIRRGEGGFGVPTEGYLEADGVPGQL